MASAINSFEIETEIVSIKDQFEKEKIRFGRKGY